MIHTLTTVQDMKQGSAICKVLNILASAHGIAEPPYFMYDAKQRRVTYKRTDELTPTEVERYRVAVYTMALYIAYA